MIPYGAGFGSSFSLAWCTPRSLLGLWLLAPVLTLKRRLTRLLDLGMLALEVPSCLERLGASAGAPSLVVAGCWGFVEPCGLGGETDGLVTETTGVVPSDGETPTLLLPDILPGFNLGIESGPPEEELELGPTPPARADCNEYSDELDIRFDSDVTDPALDIAGSGSGACLVKSDVLPLSILGVSDSSTAPSLVDVFVPSVQASDMSEIEPLRLIIEDARDDSVPYVAAPRGNEKLAGSTYASRSVGSEIVLFKLAGGGFSLEAVDSR